VVQDDLPISGTPINVVTFYFMSPRNKDSGLVQPDGTEIDRRGIWGISPAEANQNFVPRVAKGGGLVPGGGSDEENGDEDVRIMKKPRLSNEMVGSGMSIDAGCIFLR
jgi:hypothetical protein